MYLEHFQIKKIPFSLTPDTEFFCQLPSHQAVLNFLLFCSNTGEGFIKVIGEVGSGKTLLCRKLLNSLDDSFYTAYVPTPDLTPNDLRLALGRELAIELPTNIDQALLLQKILERLLALHKSGKRVVLIIDEAQALPDESLEALRLLTNLETESQKLLLIVLFAQPELNDRLKLGHLRQLNQRIVFSHHLKMLSRLDLDDYLYHRLNIAGFTKGMLFDTQARDLLYKHSRGVPRIINILAHKSMLAAYGVGSYRVTVRMVRRALADSEDILVKKNNGLTIGLWIIAVLIILSEIGFILWDILKQKL